ncbi:hypothetical protein HW090_06140 [Pseudomonas sp. ABC1]|uniref:hypothetical protein n=1 Tax=Pseudomonas sp. ABC1 TaxID=2748080 RepID=UPI0015C39C89|nr:hypothetical protein [Pseudomonas sp. ABC1]QLF92793.1 hypothetical protein HW090_06140 [Pseudomonas sp. ABC1]
MGNIQVDISPPAYWQDFELLTLDLAKTKWTDDYAERNGRQGQSQAGVDVYGYNYSSNEHTGIQCKQRKVKQKALSVTPANTLKAEEVDSEIESAKKFNPTLDRFVIATTGPRDVDLQEYVRIINEGNLPFKVSIMFWDDYVEFLNNHPKLLYRYYEDVLKFRSTYNELEHFLLLLSMAFDRPALRTPFHLESRATDFISAISATQNAVSTGRLMDRDNRIIDQCRLPKPKPKELKKISRLLQKARDLASDSLSKGLIREHPTVIEILDHSIVCQLNSLRHEAIDLLNKLLKENNLEPVEFGGF